MIDVTRSRCAHVHCAKQPTHSAPDCRPTHCGEHALFGMATTKGTRCSECQLLRPSFALPGQTADRCRAHKLPGMVNVMKKTCFAGGCALRPCFGTIGRAASHCKLHRSAHMVDVVHPKCEEAGCTLRPSFETLGLKRASRCKAHSDETMVDVIHTQRCLWPGCTKQPHFGDTMPTHCREHSLRSDVDTTNASTKCMTVGCVKRRAYGLPGGSSTHCKAHANAKTMQYLMKPKCASCNTTAWYGEPKRAATACARHRVVGMIAFPRQGCSFATCHRTGAHELASVRYCDAHKPTGAFALIVTPCSTCGLPDVLNNAGQCNTCDPTVRDRVIHAKELRVKGLLDDAGWKYESYDKVLEGGACYKYRPDFVFDAVSHFVVLEVDENQHRSYPLECERMRMLAISHALDLPTAFVRYNPDAFVCGLTGRSSRIKDATRHELLMKWLKEAFDKSDVIGTMVVHVCYDTFVATTAEWTAVVSN